MLICYHYISFFSIYYCLLNCNCMPCFGIYKSFLRIFINSFGRSYSIFLKAILVSMCLEYLICITISSPPQSLPSARGMMYLSPFPSSIILLVSLPSLPSQVYQACNTLKVLFLCLQFRKSPLTHAFSYMQASPYLHR